MKTSREEKKLYAAIIVSVFIIIFFITFEITRNHYQYVVKDTIAENKLKARFLSSLIYEHQKAATSILESYAQRPLLIDAVKKKDFNHAISHLQSLRNRHTEIDTLFITDQYGTVWANYPVSKESYGKNLAYRDWYKGVSKKWRPYISTVFRLIVLEKDLTVAVSVPVLDRKGKAIGILGSTQRTAFLATFIKGNITDPEKSITLLDQEGNIVFSNALPYQENITKYSDARVLEKAVAGVIANMEIADAKERGSISYVSIAPVRGIGWSVIVGQEKDAILKQLYGYFVRSAATGFVIFLFLAVSLLYFRKEYKYRKTKELLQAEEKYRNIVENAVEGIFQTTLEGRHIIVNPAHARMFGYDSPEDMVSSVNDIGRQLYVNPEQRKEYLRLLDAKGVINNYEIQVYRKDGSIFWIVINTRVVRDDAGNPLYYEGFVTDITGRKQAEEALLFTRFLLDNALDTMACVRQDGRFVDVNDAFCRSMGYSREQLLSMTVHDIDQTYPAETWPEFWEKLKQAGSLTFESIHRTKGGEVSPVEITVSFLEYNGKEYHSGFARDITSRKHAEEALRLSEENFRRSLDDSPLGVRIVTIEGETLYANRAMLKLYGYDSIEELRTTPLKERYTPGSYQAFQLRKEKRQRGGEGPPEYDISIVRKDGEIRHLHVFRKEVLWDGEKQFQVLYNDITKRKQAEEALRQSEEKYRDIFDRTVEGIYRTTPTGRFFILNPAFARICGYASPEEMMEKVTDIANQLYTNPEDRLRFQKLIAAEGEVKGFEVRFKHPTKGLIWISIHSKALRDEQGNIQYYDGSIEDITDRKRAEEKIKASLREKEILLREVHHRVKNNMQVISGLLDLQARSSGNPELTERLNESQRRIRSMALIHEKLYDSKDFARIELAGYVRTLSQELFQSYKVNPGKIEMIIQADDDVHVDINKAIPCGLILNELISNALKHAFPGDRPGELQIVVREAENTEIELVVRDNGLGLPDDVDPHQPRTAGLHLVNGLVKNQIDGRMEVRRDAGTEFRIKFPL